MTRTRLSKLWDQLKSSYWFVPVLMTLAAIGCALLLTAVDRRASWPEWVSAWIDTGQPEGARLLLSTIAGSTITIASLTFSITIVALTLASSHFGSRLLYNFMRSRANQFVLGAFVGIYSYCLIVMRSIRADGDEAFVPHLAVNIAVGMSIVGIGVLIFFIHHISHSIQATSVITAVRRDLCETIERFFPVADAASPSAEPARPIPRRASDQVVYSKIGGIIQAIDVRGLLALAVEQDGCIFINRRVGDYVIEGMAVARVQSSGDLSAECLEQISGKLVLGARRTMIQDVEFGMLQLVEIAVRALSPGLNDPFTACSCIDELGAALARIMGKGDLSSVEVDGDDCVRLVFDVTTFAGLTETAFNQIRQAGRHDVAVVIRLLEVLHELCAFTKAEKHVRPLTIQAEAIYTAAMNDRLADLDASAIRERYERLTAESRKALAGI